MELREKRSALIETMLPDVPFDGWSRGALAAAARRLRLDDGELALCFPEGPRNAVAEFSHWADRRMLAALSEKKLEAMKVRARIAAALRARFAALEPHREAVRRALALLALPQNVALGLRLLYDTVDAVWYAAGDTATDFNFYTKRGLLAGVLAATTLYWLDDRSPGSEETDAFLERRLDDVLALPRLGARLSEGVSWLPNPIRLLRGPRRP
ncbi:MAG TPA: COQ9 family protein [Stellaceae bacterium]|jgi:ubiquinone biosynthesis protein COQ9|nr:COQ9 family protein [Stellaceae bacterium]